MSLMFVGMETHLFTYHLNIQAKVKEVSIGLKTLLWLNYTNENSGDNIFDDEYVSNVSSVQFISFANGVYTSNDTTRFFNESLRATLINYTHCSFIINYDGFTN